MSSLAERIVRQFFCVLRATIQQLRICISYRGKMTVENDKKHGYVVI